mgnify:CR=1 FL=1
MGLFQKLRGTPDRALSLQNGGTAGLRVAQVAALGPVTAPRGCRQSNGLKDFVRHLEDLTHGSLLDLGPVWQTTVSFFIERGFKLYTDDLLSSWKDFLRADEERFRALALGDQTVEFSPPARAERFLSSAFQYSDHTFDAVLAWDLLDYLDPAMVSRVVARLTDLLRPGGAILALFHSRRPETFYRYRVLDQQNFEMVPSPPLFTVERVLQNREILNLFSRFHTSKTFVGRDQIREGLFLK